MVSILCFGFTPWSISSYVMQKEVKSEDYLKTRSEAWLDLEPSQFWCFSWFLASFSAAAIGHPDRLERQRVFSGFMDRAFHTHFGWECRNERMCCWIFGTLARLRASLNGASAHLSSDRSFPVSTSLNRADISFSVHVSSTSFQPSWSKQMLSSLVFACERPYRVELWWVYWLKNFMRWDESLTDSWSPVTARAPFVIEQGKWCSSV